MDPVKRSISDSLDCGGWSLRSEPAAVAEDGVAERACAAVRSKLPSAAVLTAGAATAAAVAVLLLAAVRLRPSGARPGGARPERAPRGGVGGTDTCQVRTRQVPSA